MFEFVSISISLCVSLSLSIHSSNISIHPAIFHLSICPSIHLSIYPSIHLFIYLSICLSIYLCLYLSISISIFLDVSAYLCIVCSGRNLKWGYHRAQCRLGPSKVRRFNLKDMWYTYMCMYLYMYNVYVDAYIHLNYTDIFKGCRPCHRPRKNRQGSQANWHKNSSVLRTLRLSTFFLCILL